VSALGHVGHLARRLLGSLSTREPAPGDVAWVEATLQDGEVALWRRMAVADRRHSILVGRRFVALRPGATRAELAAALLHDVGKLDSGLRTSGRVVATALGPRTERLRRYHDHERLGADRLAAAGSDPVTVALVRASAAPAGPAAADAVDPGAIAALHAADAL